MKRFRIRLHVIGNPNGEHVRNNYLLLSGVASQVSSDMNEIRGEMNYQLLRLFKERKEMFCPYIGEDGELYPQFVTEVEEEETP